MWCRERVIARVALTVFAKRHMRPNTGAWYSEYNPRFPQAHSRTDHPPAPFPSLSPVLSPCRTPKASTSSLPRRRRLWRLNRRHTRGRLLYYLTRAPIRSGDVSPPFAAPIWLISTPSSITGRFAAWASPPPRPPRSPRPPPARQLRRALYGLPYSCPSLHCRPQLPSPCLSPPDVAYAKTTARPSSR